MRNRISHPLAWIFFVLMSCCGLGRGSELADKATWSGSSPSDTATAVAPTAALPARQGVLYRITHDGQTSYLFGTVHAGKTAFSPLDPEVTRALAATSILVVELDIRNSEPIRRAVGKYGTYEEGDALARHLSPGALGKVNTALDAAGIKMAEVAHYRPWMVANFLLAAQMAQRGFQRGEAVENYLLASAQQQQKKVLQLESADYQLSLFTAMDDTQQERYLLENIADIQDGHALRISEDLVDAWGHADSARMEAVMQELAGGHTVTANFLLDTVLGKRNLVMLNSIEDILRANQNAFIGVGVLHLSGANGLPKLLRERGYEVVKVY